MKTLLRDLWIPLCAVLLFSCGESHFLKDESYRNQVLQDFQQKKEALPNGDLFAGVSDASLSLSEQEALMFLYAYMPVGDITDYSVAYYLENIRLAEQARREMPWGKVVSDELFRHFVLPVRVNNENLDDARKVFYAELKERVKGLSMKDAILEVNHWCHEKVVYRPSDARTSSPLASVRTAYGRCGEESTFAVAALRSVGIPARQVYTPRWAHTDDNHAWVEAWADGKWYFLGACEPEPVLNLGWFNAPASRGMLMHTKVFGRYEGPEEVMAVTPSYTEINVIDNYAPTAKAVVTVKDVEGRTVEGAQVDFKVYNYAEFFTVATKTTDKNGCASLTAGKGDMLVWASKDGRFGYAKYSFGKDKELTLVLSKQEGETYSVDLDIVPPVEGANLPEVSEEQRKENDARMAQEDAVRNAYVATLMDEKKAAEALQPFGLKRECLAKSIQMLVASRGNYQTLLDFFQFAHGQGKAEQAAALLDVLSEKDWRDVPLEVLKDHFAHTAMKEGMSLVDWSVLANPRVDVEMLTPYRSFFLNQFSKEEAAAFAESPARLVDWCIEHIEVDNELNVQRIPVSPAGVWKARKADERSRNIFFVSVARSLGINAQIDAVTGKVQYVEPRDGKLYDVNFAVRSLHRVPTGTLKAAYRPIKSLSDPKYYSHFTLSKFKDGRFQLLSYDEGDADMGGGATWGNLLKEGLRLDVGYYMLITGTRMASGAVLSQVSFFTIEEGKETKVELVMRESKDQVQVIGNFNSESLFQPVGAPAPAKSLLQACGRGYFVVGVLGVGQEPTNHALRDIAALRGEFEKWGRQMVLLFPSEEQYKKFRPEEFPGLPSTIQYGIDIDNSIQKQIYETMKLSSKNTLPMFIIADTFNRVVFVSQGYTIGLGEQLMKVVHGL